jgi:DNA phosphorothioation-associated putative methyltransferase
LIVSAQVLIDDYQRGLVAYSDGVITARNTFQKYFQQEELKIYIDRVLNVDAIPAGLGSYFVFKELDRAEAFRASRFCSRVSTPRVQAKVRNFEDYQELLNPLMEFYTKRGRLPIKQELVQEEDIKGEFGTYRRAFNLVLQATNADEWDAISEKRRQDLLIYLALAKFNNRPSSQKLAPELREDIKALFGSYKVACLFADQLLFSVGNIKKIAHLCKQSPLGKKLHNALAIHISALSQLEPLLRLYEGCASRNFSRLEEANVIKLYFDRPKITYLFYPAFDTAPYPTLHSSMAVDLRNLNIVYQNYSERIRPPVLREKQTLVASDYPFFLG